jgi:hypothetical protein
MKSLLVAAWVPDMFCKFYLVKIKKMLITQKMQPDEKISIDLKFLEF